MNTHVHINYLRQIFSLISFIIRIKVHTCVENIDFLIMKLSGVQSIFMQTLMYTDIYAARNNYYNLHENLFNLIHVIKKFLIWILGDIQTIIFIILLIEVKRIGKHEICHPFKVNLFRLLRRDVCPDVIWRSVKGNDSHPSTSHRSTLDTTCFTVTGCAEQRAFLILWFTECNAKVIWMVDLLWYPFSRSRLQHSRKAICFGDKVQLNLVGERGRWKFSWWQRAQSSLLPYFIFLYVCGYIMKINENVQSFRSLKPWLIFSCLSSVFHFYSLYTSSPLLFISLFFSSNLLSPLRSLLFPILFSLVLRFPLCSFLLISFLLFYSSYSSLSFSSF